MPQSSTPPHDERTPRVRRPALRWVERALWVVGIVLLGWVAFVWSEGRAYQSRAEAELDRAIAAARAAEESVERRAREEPDGSEEDEADDEAEGALPVELPGDRGSEEAPRTARASASKVRVDDLPILGKLEIPRLDLSVMVAEGTSSRVLRRGAGHITGTARPGQAGNAGLAAHRDRHFRPLEHVLPGDEVIFTGVDGTFRYQVQWTSIVPPEEVEVLAPTDAPALTLVTCYPFRYLGNAPERFVVRARQIGSAPDEPAVARAGR